MNYHHAIQFLICCIGLAIAYNAFCKKTITTIPTPPKSEDIATKLIEQASAKIAAHDYRFGELEMRRIIKNYPNTTQAILADSLLELMHALEIDRNLDILSMIKRETRLVRNFEGEDCRGSYKKLANEERMFRNWATVVRDYEINPCPKIIDAALALKKHLVFLQEEEFPWIRDDFSKLIRKKMKANGVAVLNTGKNKVLTLSSSIFKDPETRDRYYRKLEPKLYDYRFVCLEFKYGDNVKGREAIYSETDGVLIPLDCIMFETATEDVEEINKIEKEIRKDIVYVN